jgi:hypothetical protein
MPYGAPYAFLAPYLPFGAPFAFCKPYLPFGFPLKKKNTHDKMSGNQKGPWFF